MKEFHPPSLLQRFAPSDGYVGTFGWLCGYSADAGFLDAAAERFALQTSGQRAYAGKVSLVSLLDQGQPQILPHEAPGVLHAPLADASRFAMLHAKVALLGFQHLEDPGRWRVRLLVSTGNWTRETLEQSLDLAWSAEFDAHDLSSRDGEHMQARADIRAAWALMQWLMPLFDLRALEAASGGLTGIARERLADWCQSIERRGLPPPRFFDSRARSLLRQLPRMARQQAGAGIRNALTLGSGFYEGGKSRGAPTALVRIVDALKQNGLVTANCEVNVIVEPGNCQAVATALPAMRELGWRVWPASQPGYLKNKRTLHAKFVFASGRRTNSDACLNGWLYLGSGNLTAPGFLASCPRGNLEAGVVIDAASLSWSKKPAPERWANNRLPLKQDPEVQTAQELAAGVGMPDRPPAFEVPPVAWCRYLPACEEAPARLVLPAHEAPFEILDTQARACVHVSPSEVLWPGALQPSVVVRWQEHDRAHQCSIPVIDSAGRVAALALPSLDLESAWWQLQHFPRPPAEEDTAGDAREFEPGEALGPVPNVQPNDSVVRTMMRLIENIAERQAGLSLAEWDAWCISLEQALRQAADCEVVSVFAQQLGLDPLDALRQPSCLPLFARDIESPQHRRYIAVMDALQASWGVRGLPSVARTREIHCGLV